MALAHDSIYIELSPTEQIEGIAAFEQRIGNWFEAADVSMNAIWCVPIQYHEEDGTPDNGNWLIAGYDFTSIQGTRRRSWTDMPMCASSTEGSLRGLHPRTTQRRKDRSVTLSVDMNGYDGEYSSVNVYGFFNGWCASCNKMTDEDGDGVYRHGARHRRRDGIQVYLGRRRDLQEMFEAGTAHQDHRRLHQPLGAS